MLKIAKKVLPKEKWKLVVRRFDVVGDIAIIKLPNELENEKFLVANALLKELSSIRVVLRQVSPIKGTYRLRKLEWLAGERRTETVHREYGCVFRVDLQKTYFSPRLEYERARIAKLVKSGEIVVNMFSGVGCFSILIAKKNPTCLVYSIDINPDAIYLQKINVALNKVIGKVIVIEGDAKEIIEERLRDAVNRVLMPLPEKAYEYLEYAILALKEAGVVHYYDFVHAKRKKEDPIEKVRLKVERRLQELKVRGKVEYGRIVRLVGPNWYQIVLDISVEK
jgi:tRNA (guanine37-N1)-methyltransferase